MTQRYRAHTQAVADPDGEFVTYSDYQALEAQYQAELVAHQRTINDWKLDAAKIEAAKKAQS